MATEHKPYPLAALDIECFHCLTPLVFATDFNGEFGRWVAQTPNPGVDSGVCGADEHVPDRRPFYVNVYAATRHYGGPEEGGWWYDAGEPVASTPFLHRAAAEQARDIARVTFPSTGKRDSVLGGDDWTVCIERDFAQSYPTQRPRYE